MATSTSYSEDQFLLRVPPELAEKLNAALDGGPGLDIDIDWKGTQHSSAAGLTVCRGASSCC